MLDMTPLPVPFSQMYKFTKIDIMNYQYGIIYDMMVLNMLKLYFMPYYIISSIAVENQA
jgi:hypothetical protein